MSEFRFRVDLTHDGNTLQSVDDALNIANTKTLYLPLGIASLPTKKLKHGDTFVVTGAQGAYLKRLVTDGKILNIVIDSEVETVSSLQLLSANNYGLYSVLLDGDQFSIGGIVYEFDEDVLSIDLNDINDVRIASDGEYTYVLMGLDDNEFRFFKVNSAGETTLIETTGFDFAYMSRTSISDGFDDMYDDGNYLNTNRATEIIYTHEPNAAGEVADGTTWFGSESQYFTNNKDSVFSLVATGIDITGFYISGNLGADGSGNVKHDQFVASVGGHDFTIFYKCVYGTSDPSVNHLIIVPGNLVMFPDLEHSVASSTDNDSDAVDGLTGVTRLAYILFATSDEVEESVLQNVAEAFIEDTNFRTGTIASILSSLNALDLANLIPNIIVFDDGDAAESSGGVEDLDSMTYIGNNQLAILDDGIYKILSTSGEVILQRESDAFMSFSDLVYYQGHLYGFGYGNILYEVNKDTGVPHGEGDEEDKKSRILAWKEDSSEEFDIEYMAMPFVSNDRLYATAYGEEYALVEVLPDANEITFVDWYNTDDDAIIDIEESLITENKNDEIGLSSEDYKNIFSWFWSDTIHADESLFSQEPTVENLVVQWAEFSWEEEDEGPIFGEWGNVEITDVTLDGDQWEISYNEPTEDGYMLRMRYSSGELWHYIQED